MLSLALKWFYYASKTTINHFITFPTPIRNEKDGVLCGKCPHTVYTGLGNSEELVISTPSFSYDPLLLHPSNKSTGNTLAC